MPPAEDATAAGLPEALTRRGTGALIRAHDWAATPLGPIAAWPAPLAALVRLILGAGQPMFLVWGAERRLIYNDAYAAILGDKHPAALGRDFLEAWGEIRDALRPIVARAYAGEPVQMPDIALAMQRHGHPEEAHFAFSYTPLHDPAGVVDGFFCCCIEITEQVFAERRREEAEAALRRERDRSREILESISDAFYAVDAEGRFTHVNRRAAEWWSRDAGALIGQPIWDAFPEAIGSAAQAAHRQAMREAVPVRVETVSPVLGHAISIDIHPTRGGGLAVFFRDISRRRRQEERLRDSEEQLAAIFTEASVGLSELDLEARFLRVNDELCRILDRPRAVLLQAGIADVTHAEDLAPSRERLARTIATGQRTDLDKRYRRPDGSLVWANSSVSLLRQPDGTPRGFLVVTADLTARRQAEALLRRNEERTAFLLRLSDALRPLGDSAAIQAQAARVLGEQLGASRACYVEIDGITGERVVACDWHQPGETSHAGRFPAEDAPLPPLAEAGSRVLRDTESDPTVPEAQRALYRRHGVGALVAVPLVKEGRLVACCLVSQRRPRDWTAEEVRLVEDAAERSWAALARARAEAALRDSEERYRAILASALDYAIFTTDPDGRIVTWSPGAEAVFGWTAAEAIGCDAAMTFVPEDRAAGAPAAERAEARSQGFAAHRRWHLRRDGRRVFIEGSMRPLRHGGTEPHDYLTVGQDVTERRAWDERQKVLLAELQHRTRNLMGVVRATFDRTRQDSADIHALAETYMDRLAALARVQGLLSRLAEGSRVSFDELIRAELSAMGALDARGEGVQVALDGPEGVRLRSTTLQTFALALHELATNALKYGALSQPGGRLRVQWRLLRAADGPRLCIEWRESGVAMPPPGAAPRPESGYGRELIEKALPYQLDAETSYQLGPDGVHCTITLPVSDSMRSEASRDA